MTRSNAAALVAGLIVVGYIGFELYALKHVGYRMEPLFIYDLVLKDRYGATTCGDVDRAQLEQFDHNLVSIERRARAQLAEREALTTAEDVDAALAARRAQAEADASALLAPEGCDGIEAYKLRKGFENWARRNLN